MPKEVDHQARRRELADAACRVIGSGWSIGSMRYYFPSKDELLAAALWRVGERIDERIRHRTAGGMSLADLRTAALELLPLDTSRREESRVLLAFLAQAAVVPELAAAADNAAQRLQEPFSARIAHAIQADELPAHLDPEHEAIRLQLLIYGLMVELATTTTDQRQLATWAQAILDDHFAALAAAPPPAPQRHVPARPR
jgi:AcrR family transcriptional regulator